MTHEKPQNGLAGLKYWKHDLLVGLALVIYATILMEAPHELLNMQPTIFGIGFASLLLMVVLYLFRDRSRFLQPFSPQLVTVIAGTILAQIFVLDKKFLISLPSNPLANAIHLDNFTSLLAHPGLLSSVPVLILTLTLIDGIESLWKVAT